MSALDHLQPQLFMREEQARAALRIPYTFEGGLHTGRYDLHAPIDRGPMPAASLQHPERFKRPDVAQSELNAPAGGQQLRTHMRASEIMRDVTPLDGFEGETTEGMWKRKAEENTFSGPGTPPLDALVKRGGVREPVDIGPASHFSTDETAVGDALIDGHHRVQAALKSRDAYVPLLYHEDYDALDKHYLKHG